MYASAQPLDFLARTKTFRLTPVRGMTRLCLLSESETASLLSGVSGWKPGMSAEMAKNYRIFQATGLLHE
jgi:hypothetical protein